MSLKSLISSYALLSGLVSAQQTGTQPQSGIKPNGPASQPVFGSLASAALPQIRFHGAVDKQAQIRPGAKRTLFKYGPLRLVGKDDPLPPSWIPSMDRHGQSFLLMAARGVCSNCTVLYGIPGLEFADGSEAKGVYVHHFISFDVSKTDASIVERCPLPSANWLWSGLKVARDMLGAGFLGQGDDSFDSPIYFTTTDGQYQSGFHMGVDDKILFNADLVNYNANPLDVYITLDLEYVDGHVGRDTTSELLGVGGCNLLGAPKVSKDGPVTTRSPEFTILNDGAILSARGHMHDGGERMVISLNGNPVCTSTAKYKTGSSTAGGIAEMTRCGDAIPVKKGDTLTLESMYDLKRHPMRKDSQHGGEAHGIMAGMDFMGMWAITMTSRAP